MSRYPGLTRTWASTITSLVLAR